MTDPNPPRNPVVLIPARMASSRLPGKPLADIAGLPMIAQVLRRAEEAEVGPVWVACAEPEIADAVAAAGGRAVLTDPGHASGSDRIAEALAKIDPDRTFDAVVNVQGDLPTIDPASVRAAVALLDEAAVDIGTLVAIIADMHEIEDPNVVKAVVEMPAGARRGRALYFTRLPGPWGDGPRLHHIGLYTYRRAALEAFVKLPPSALERRERLEQLRALAHGMRLDVAVVDAVPLGVDTPADLERARQILRQS